MKRNRVKSSQKSQSHPEKTLMDVILGMFIAIYELIKKDPYFAIVTKQGLMLGNGLLKHLNEADYRRTPFLRPGYRDKRPCHIMASKPAPFAVDQQVADFGFHLPWPPFGFLDFIQGGYRKFLKWLVEKKYTNIKAIPFKNYYDEDGNIKKLDIQKAEGWHHKMTLGWTLIDMSKLDHAISYCLGDDSPKWAAWQLMDAAYFGPQILQEQYEKMKAATDRKLIEHDETLDAAMLIHGKIPEDKWIEFKVKLQISD